MVLVYVDVFNSQDEIIEKSTFNPQPIKDDEGNDTGLILWHSKIVSKGGDGFDAGCGNAIGGDTGNVDADVETVNNCIDAEKGFGYNAKLHHKAHLIKKPKVAFEKKVCSHAHARAHCNSSAAKRLV